MTNEEKIKQFDTKTLAAFLSEFQPCFYCKVPDCNADFGYQDGKKCLAGLIQYLKSDAK